MKSLKALCITLIAVFMLSTCEQYETPEPEIQEELLEVIFLEESSHLQSLVNNIGSSPNARTNPLLNDVDFDRAVKRLNPETGNTHYTFSMKSENGLSMRKFVLTENKVGKLFGHAFEYEVDAEWYYEQDSFPGWHQYNGYFRIVDLDGITISENKISKGSSEAVEAENGRTSGMICFVTTNLICKGTASNPCQFWYYDTFTDCFFIPSGGGGAGSGFGDLDGYTSNPLPEREVFSFDVPLDYPGISPSSLSPADAWEQEICQNEEFLNNDCVQDVWNKMKELNVGYETLKNFLGDNPKAELCLDIKDLGSATNSPNGNAGPSGTYNNATVTINLNSEKLNRSKLSIARTLLHEMIHAELWSMVIEAGGYDNFQSYAENYDNEFLAIWNYIEEFEPKGWQHEYMADNYITYIADGLRSLEPFFVSSSFKNATNNGYYDNVIGESWNWDNFYDYMAWAGLHNTEQFQTDIVDKNLKNKYDQYRLRFEDGNSVNLDCQ